MRWFCFFIFSTWALFFISKWSVGVKPRRAAERVKKNAFSSLSRQKNIDIIAHMLRNWRNHTIVDLGSLDCIRMNLWLAVFFSLNINFSQRTLTNKNTYTYAWPLSEQNFSERQMKMKTRRTLLSYFFSLLEHFCKRYSHEAKTKYIILRQTFENYRGMIETQRLMMNGKLIWIWENCLC